MGLKEQASHLGLRLNIRRSVEEDGPTTPPRECVRGCSSAIANRSNLARKVLAGEISFSEATNAHIEWLGACGMGFTVDPDIPDSRAAIQTASPPKTTYSAECMGARMPLDEEPIESEY